MYPHDIIFGYDLYDIFMLIGIISALVVVDRAMVYKKIPNNIQIFFLITTIVSVISGLFFSTLFQAVYNFIEHGEFKFEGMTFLGGLLGGIGTFLLIYYLFNKYYFKGVLTKNMTIIVQIAPACIAIAHMFGRIGCFMAGCCHGKASPHGIVFPYLYGIKNNAGIAYLPTQLYEVIFLALMFGATLYLFLKKPDYSMPAYLIGYGIFRFILEFFRGDDRGQFLISFLSPSQQICLLLLIAGGVMLYKVVKKDFFNKPPETVPEKPSEIIDTSDIKTENVETADTVEK